MTEIAIPLTPDEARSLTDEIRGATERVFRLLLRAYEGNAWQALGYGSWRDYAMTEFGMSQSHAYRLLDQGRVVREIEDAAVAAQGELSETESSPIGETAISEAAARELVPLLGQPEKLREAWSEARDAADGKPTAADVKTARERVSPPRSRQVPALPEPEPEPEDAPVEDPVLDGGTTDLPAGRMSEDPPLEGTVTLLRRPTRSLMDVAEELNPGAKADVGRAKLRSRWSSAMAAMADLALMNAEEVRATIPANQISMGEIAMDGGNRLFDRLRQLDSSGLRAVGGDE